MLNEFVWERNNRVKRSTMTNNYENGGLKMPDVQCTMMGLRLVWLRRLLDVWKWSQIIHKHFERYGRVFYDAELFTDIHVYRKTLLFALYIFMLDKNKVIIWDNIEIKINNQTVFWKTWKDKVLTILGYVFWKPL